MNTDWLDPAFNPAATAIAGLLALYLLLGEPFLGRGMYRRLAERRDTDPRALVGFYRLTLGVQLVSAALALIAVAPGLTGAHVGLARPRGQYLGWAVGFTVYLVVVIVGTGVLLRKRALSGKPVSGQAAVAAMLPRTRRERAYATAISVGAGVSEELVYRGLLIAAGVGLFGLTPLRAATVAVVVFAFAHLYQGPLAMLGVGLLGALFAGLYLTTGSILLAVLAHTVFDVRGLVFVPGPQQEKSLPQ
ncbi:CPBP family intramembrane glutamic endopeptidase [Cryptosporangium sp. NPDC051539]|uniref:CPBP family intramembrane glutamic endopeptidase n=1 Tax=Cryptosporangium sp. NPDC051539 TaxID=3363962 RepID=UPI0037AEE681